MTTLELAVAGLTLLGGVLSVFVRRALVRGDGVNDKLSDHEARLRVQESTTSLIKDDIRDIKDAIKDIRDKIFERK